MTGFIGRRDFLKATGGMALGAGLAGLAGCGSGDSGPSQLRVAWYGGKPVHEAMKAALAAYRKGNKDTKLASEFSAFQDYWDKLATQTAGGRAPDVMRMSMSYFAEYVDRGALLDLSEFVGNQIDVSTLDKSVVESGKVDGKFRGIGQSSISHATFLSKTKLDEAGVSMPDHDWTWDDLAALAERYVKAVGKKGVFGTPDAGGNLQIFDVFVRQHGTEMFDGQKLAFGKQVLADWLGYWDELRKTKLAVSTEIMAESIGFENKPVIKGIAPLGFGWVQQVTFLQPLTEDELVLTMVPSGTGDAAAPGQFLKALDFWVCSSRTEHPEETAKLVSFLLNDPKATGEIGMTLGVPPSAKARDAAASDPDSPAAKAAEYVEFVTDKVSPAREIWPKGYGELLSLLTRVNEDVGNGKQSVDEGVKQFFSEAERALSS